MNPGQELIQRGLVENASAPIERILEVPRKIYFGADPTADSFHVGHLVPILLTRRLADLGHKITLLVGGGTGMIGDPKESGDRPLLDKKIINSNKKALKSQLQRILGKKISVVDNADWLLNKRFIDFLQDTGKYFSINELVKRDIIKRRLNSGNDPISYTEFSYSLLQGYDFLNLFIHKGIEVQIGGADQWTNMLSGVELIRRRLGKEAFVFTGPIVTDASGKKFGKSEGNAVWLDPNRTTPRDFYDFWVNLPDEGIEKYLKIYTFLSLQEIENTIKQHQKNKSLKVAQQILAKEMLRIVHPE